MPGAWGEFEVLEQLGQGSSATVYRARDAAGREVALKVAKESLAPDQLQRFLREGELARRLDHPGLVRVEGWGEVAGVPYLALELTPGARPLDEAWAEWEPARRVDAVRQAAEALAAAHAAGLVHRDLKPANLLVEPSGRVRVADFGLSWQAGLESLTQSRALVGTPLYMAPEVWSAPGKAPRRQPALDVWSLGVLLYEALTGQHPYGSPGEPQVAILRRLQRPLRSPRALRPETPAAWEATCLRALTRDPATRFPDAGAFAAALAAPPAAPRGLSLPALALGSLALLALAWALLAAPAPRPRAARSAQGAPSAQPATPTPRPSGAPLSPTPKAAPTTTPSGAPGAPGLAELLARPAPSATLKADPNPAPAPPGGIGRTTIRWTSVGCERTPSLWVHQESRGDAEPTLFARGREGSDPAPWIALGDRYRFRLYAGPTRDFPLLAELWVEARRSPRLRGELSCAPNPVRVAPGERGAATLRWSSEAEAEATLWLFRAADDPGRQVARGRRGERRIEWFQLEPRPYRFRLYAGPDPSAPLLAEQVVRVEERAP